MIIYSTSNLKKSSELILTSSDQSQDGLRSIFI